MSEPLHHDIKAYLEDRYALKIDDYPAFRKFVDEVAVEMGFPTNDMTVKHPAFIEAVRRKKAK